MIIICRITFGHVSPRTLCAQVAIEKLPLRKRAAVVTINPTSSIPSVTNLARMVRRAFCLLIFLSCLSVFPSNPFLTRTTSVLISLSLSLPPSLPLSLSLSFALIRSRAGCARSRSGNTWLCQLHAFLVLISAPASPGGRERDRGIEGRESDSQLPARQHRLIVTVKKINK